MTSKWRHILKNLLWIWIQDLKITPCAKFGLDQVLILKIIQVSLFFQPKKTWHTGNKRLLWQHLTTKVIDKIREMSIKGVKLKSESFFPISPGVLELWRKSLGGGGGEDSALPQVQIGLKCKWNVFFYCWIWKSSKSRKITVYRFLISLLVLEL